MTRDDERTDVEPLITVVTKRAETGAEIEITREIFSDKDKSGPIAHPLPAPPPEPTPPPLSASPVVPPPALNPVPVPVPVPVPAPVPDPAPDPGDPDDLGDLDDEDEPGWAALWSYETYEAVARKVLRAGTEVAREGYQRHDAAVVVIALFMIIAGGIVHRLLLRPAMEPFDQHGLRFERTAHWLAPEPVSPAPPRLVRDAPTPPRAMPDELPYHVMFASALDGEVRLEVVVDDRPTWSNVLTGLELERRNRFGELYASDGGSTRSIAGHDWLRTSFRYAYSPEKGDEPRIGRAVEYATVDRERIYAVTFHGSPAQIENLEEWIAPTLRVESRTGVPLLPQNRVTQARAPAPVRVAQESTVMVVVADLVDGRLRAVGGGSGVVVHGDGSIATNYHVIHDKNGRLHDVFVIGRHLADGKPPQLVCAGRPSRSKWDAKLDLALVKCDMDLDGRAWSPLSAGAWQPIPSPPDEGVGLGQRLWVLGYPDVGGGSITLSQGLVEGWTGEEESLGRDFIKTDASITHGNSGGPVVDDDGQVVGLATAFRVRFTGDGRAIETSKVGLVRPWAALDEAIANARAGWIPAVGKNSFAIEPNAVEVSAEGVLISTRVVDAANNRPVQGAMLMVLRPEVSSNDLDMNRLDDQVLAWGRANSDGEVHLKQPVPSPGTYTVVVVARGYEPLTGDGALQLTEETAPFWDPWGEVKIKAQP